MKTLGGSAQERAKNLGSLGPWVLGCLVRSLACRRDDRKTFKEGAGYETGRYRNLSPCAPETPRLAGRETLPPPSARMSDDRIVSRRRGRCFSIGIRTFLQGLVYDGTLFIDVW